jgi:hypothetical protein
MLITPVFSPVLCFSDLRADDRWGLAVWIDPQKETGHKKQEEPTVQGVTSVGLKFGEEGPVRYDELLSAGAFAEFSSQ